MPTFCDSQDEVRNNTRQKQSLDWAKAASVIGFTEYAMCRQISETRIENINIRNWSTNWTSIVGHLVIKNLY